MNAENLENLMRWLLTAGIWLLILILLGGAVLVMRWLGVAIPTLAYVLPLIIGGLVSGLIWTPATWDTIKEKKLADFQRQIDEQLGQLSEAELQEVLAHLEEAKIELGFRPAQEETAEKRKKRKREDLDQRLRRLEDDELLRLKQQIAEGNMDDDDLISWLDRDA